MRKIGLISCVSKKKEGIHQAKDLYDSALFAKAKTYAEKYYDSWFILSAKYNLLRPNRKISCYDKTLGDMNRSVKRIWAEKTFKQIRGSITQKNTIIYFHAGIDYREYLLPLLKEAGYVVRIPLKNLRIGEQLSWYDKRA